MNQYSLSFYDFQKKGILDQNGPLIKKFRKNLSVGNYGILFGICMWPAFCLNKLMQRLRKITENTEY